MRTRLLCFLYFTHLFGFAQQSDTSLTSAEAVKIALENNLSIKIVQADRDIAAINNNWGNAGRWPSININMANTEATSSLNQVLTNGSVIKRDGVSNNFLNGNASLTWRIYNGRRIVATKQRFEELEKIGQLNLELQMQQITHDVLVTFYNIVRLNQQIKANDAIIALSRERYQIAKTRYDVGSAAKTDMLQSEIDLNEQLVNLGNIDLQLRQTKALMNTLLKRDPEFKIVINDTDFHIPHLDYARALQLVDTQNISLLRIQRQKAILLEEKKIIQSGRLPTLNLNSVASYNRTKATAGFFLTNQTYGPNIGLSMSIPIFNSNQFRTQARVNEVQRKQQQLQEEQLKIQVKQDLFLAFQELENAMNTAETEKVNVARANENNFIATERFRKLQGNSIELRQAQLSLIQAQDRYFDALFRQKRAATSIQLLLGEVSEK